jgi:hypothetical protein
VVVVVVVVVDDGGTEVVVVVVADGGPLGPEGEESPQATAQAAKNPIPAAFIIRRSTRTSSPLR